MNFFKKWWNRFIRYNFLRRNGFSIKYREKENQTLLRAEILSIDQMEEQGKKLASSHTVSQGWRTDRLLSRLDDNEQILISTNNLLSITVKDKHRISPAGEWLLDNFYLIEEQINIARKHFPKGYSRELPRLASGPSIGLPRVYDLAFEIISHGDGRIDEENLTRFVSAYQTVTPLTLGELWAIPIMLRLGLIENLRRVGVHITQKRHHLNKAREWANQMMTIAESDPKSLILVIADMARSKPALVSSFVAELARRLQGHGPSLALPLTWVEQRLSESNQTIEQLIRSENQQMATDQVSVSNTIGSLRFLSTLDWRVFVEKMSFVEQILLQDHDNIYGSMDFETRDRYRHVIDRLAKQSLFSEIDIAHKAIYLSKQSTIVMGKTSHTAHVGYYLIDEGLLELEKTVKPKFHLISWLQKQVKKTGWAIHFGSFFLLTISTSAWLLEESCLAGLSGWKIAVFASVLLISISQVTSTLMNWLATLEVLPERLPRMDYTKGIPIERRTIIVIPLLLSNINKVDELLEALEVRFLGNQDNYLHFALLTDFTDAKTETLTSDSPLLSYVQNGIKQLNIKYNTVPTTGPTEDRFFLFHRPRLYNPIAKCWMGYERKRGKLAALNQLLRGSDFSKFSLVEGNIIALSTVKYVITLDKDTQLPRDTARQFIAVMAHPLNNPRFDLTKNIVTGGYGILQPSMASSLIGSNRSHYARLCSSDIGVDPYTRAISNVYQDVFSEGSFVGKGIYDIDAFERVLNDRLPENRILSHDLLEGCYIRSGLISDVQLYEDHPVRYDIDVLRQERWIRGDWQIARWLMPTVPELKKQSAKNPLSALSRWKIFDNLRRSLVPTAMMLLLIIGWIATTCPWFWTYTVAGILLIPTISTALVDLFRRSNDVPFRQHLRTILYSARRQLTEIGFRFTCLPYEASFTFFAIVRSLLNLFIYKSHLLDWNSFGEHQTNGKAGILKSYQTMVASLVITGFIATSLAVFESSALSAATPFLLLWLTGPAITWWLNQPIARKEIILSKDQRLFLSKIARKTWSFFERFVTAEDNWLPPDNFQEQPGPMIAHRTSPTNIGLSLLANLSAHDFGFISTGNLLTRTKNTFYTLSQLPRHQGHFCNWYDTQTLQPLKPRYISTVDSGNLAGHLLTLRVALLELPNKPIIPTPIFEGLYLTLELLNDSIKNLKSDVKTVTRQETITNLQLILAPALINQPFSIMAQFHLLEQLATAASTLTQFANLNAPGNLEFETPVQQWAKTFVEQTQDTLKDIKWLFPWLSLPDNSEIICKLIGLEDLYHQEKKPSLKELLVLLPKCIIAIDTQMKLPLNETNHQWLIILRPLLYLAKDRVAERILHSEQLTLQATEFATMEYDFLYDKSRHLLSIGYNLDDLRRDNGFYDLLASEARLCTFVAISQGKLPQKSWFALGRSLTNSVGDYILVSWSGSMFEYLMPMLVMPTYEGTLLDQTCRIAVKRQIAFGNQRSLPWGVSESGFSTVDAGLNYQYHAFGVPGLGLKRGLAEDSVVTPYASALALMVEPEAACANLQRLSLLGAEGQFGFYEAIDYTPSRLNRGQNQIIVQSFMAHHQGMSLLSLAHLLLNGQMQRRFASDPLFQATLLLLQEKIPKATNVRVFVSEHSVGETFHDLPTMPVNLPIDAITSTPEVQLLSNGRYHVMITNAGSGYSHWKDLAVTRWREDITCDNWGSFIYLRDIKSGEFWSATHQPTLKKADSYVALFSEGRAEFRRNDHLYETYSEIVVSPEDDIELRRVRITNRAKDTRTIEITSYAEVVLATQASDLMQTAFGNLFIQTEILTELKAILCTRRPRSENDKSPWMFHLFETNGTAVSHPSFETDRIHFIGRGNSTIAPQVISAAMSLSNSEGSVLDPIVSIRCNVTLETEETAIIDIISGIANSREECLALVKKYQDRHFADRVFDIAGTHSSVTLRQLNASESEAQLYRKLAGSVLFVKPALRADASLLMQNRRGQSDLWGYSISGDMPIVLLKITEIANLELAHQLIQCHAYWRLKGLSVDLVILNEDQVGYRQQIQDQIRGLIATGSESHTIGRPGGIYICSAEQVPNENRVLLQAVARAIIIDTRGTLEEQVNRRVLSRIQMDKLIPGHKQYDDIKTVALEQNPELILNNTLGGFNLEGNEYIITTTPTNKTPLPWVNILANPHFGTVITESGLAYTWSENAHEFRLTPWSDDSVGAKGGEAFYLRDEDSGLFWSPTPLPCRGSQPYITHHGFGYSLFEYEEFGIHSTLCVFVDLKATVKYSVLKVRNQSGRSRHLSATGFVEWVLGDLRSKTAQHVVSEIDGKNGALFARNSYNTEFAGRVAFFDVDDVSRTFTADRTEFIGRNGSLANPNAMKRTRLSGHHGASMDPCGAFQVTFNLDDGQEREIIFRLGTGHDIGSARELAQRLRKPGSARTALQKVKQYWQQTLSAVKIETPDASLNVLANGWLLYQTQACRLWARSGYYQSGGAFGFRDQLQDVMALVHSEPTLVREHILRAAARQYPEGDVQHWWHPPTGRGVRTRCSDDYLWLPLVVCRYVQCTGDISILNTPVRFIEGRLLKDDEESYYDLPNISSQEASLYQHCVLAILNGLNFGEHGLPLIGSGDWNDGMNLVGIEGKGESVWLGFFLSKVLISFSEIAKLQGDLKFALNCENEASQLKINLEKNGWDGEWFRRAYFDDGSVLGSSENAECVIDSIAQSWSVLSGAGSYEKTRIAMNSLDQRLVRRDDKIVQLLDPPFDKSPMNPGYIKGYVPGVRENGGQYTHAAIWATMAFAAQGDNARAWELLTMINPINHGLNSQEINQYKAEPYVVAADVYAITPHTGRGGWTWYTGSASWLYQLIVESLLGLNRQGNYLRITPCLCPDWKSYRINYRFGTTQYPIVVTQKFISQGLPVSTIRLDGVEVGELGIPLQDDHQIHQVEVSISTVSVPIERKNGFVKV